MMRITAALCAIHFFFTPCFAENTEELKVRANKVLKSFISKEYLAGRALKAKGFSPGTIVKLLSINVERVFCDKKSFFNQDCHSVLNYTLSSEAEGSRQVKILVNFKKNDINNEIFVRPLWQFIEPYQNENAMELAGKSVELGMNALAVRLLLGRPEEIENEGLLEVYRYRNKELKFQRNRLISINSY